MTMHGVQNRRSGTTPHCVAHRPLRCQLTENEHTSKLRVKHVRISVSTLQQMQMTTIYSDIKYKLSNINLFSLQRSLL